MYAVKKTKEEDYSMGMTPKDWMNELFKDRSGMFYNAGAFLEFRKDPLNSAMRAYFNGVSFKLFHDENPYDREHHVERNPQKLFIYTKDSLESWRPITDKVISHVWTDEKDVRRKRRGTYNPDTNEIEWSEWELSEDRGNTSTPGCACCGE